MNSSFTRRQVAKGAVWAAPVVVATVAVPAYAASPTQYKFSASWNTTLTLVGDPACPADQGYVSGFNFETTTPIAGEVPGFAVVGVDGAPITNATVNNLRFEVAYLSGLISNIAVEGGDWTSSGPTTTSIAGAPYNTYDVFTFTWTGVPTQDTSGNSWVNSPLTTFVSYYNDVCVPRTDDVYYVKWLGNFTTDSGQTTNLDRGWIKTPLYVRTVQ